VPGESFVSALDALYDVDTPRFILCRHESAASNAAEAYGKATGRPGLCYVTRGPGISHGAIGIHTARQDSSPMIMLVGGIVRANQGREGWQEIDVVQMFAGVAKFGMQIEAAARIPEVVRHAYAVAMSGRPGPVVLAIPEDVLDELASVADLPPAERARSFPAPDDVVRLRSILAGAQRPLVIVGGSGWDAQSRADLHAFAERSGLPVATGFRTQALFDNEHPLYAGTAGIGVDPALSKRIRAADVILAINTRLDEVTTSAYFLLEPPLPKQRLIHVYPGADELNHVYVAELAIAAGPIETLAALAAMEPLDGAAWSTWASDAHADYVRREEGKPSPGKLNMVEVMASVRELLPRDAIITTGAGNYAAWSHRFYRYTQPGTQIAPLSGAMGYGLPAAIAQKLIYPERVVVAFAGDGCFQMSGHELGTAVQHGLNVIVVLIDNGIHGSIRVHQERNFPGRVIGTSIVNPDFVTYAQAFGAQAERIETAAEFGPALQRALAATKPAVLVLQLDPDAITPDASLTMIRERAAAKQA
jgi:acetolactate synthase-1/2/3 large subunit